MNFLTSGSSPAVYCKDVIRHRFRAGLSVVVLGLPLFAQAGVPISISLDQPATATVVVERTDGTRVANLVAETLMAAGRHTFYWDGYDVGLQPDEHSPYVRQRVEPGTYRVRGLVHEGIRMRYEMSLYSPGVTPWKNADGTGSWLGDHSVNADCLFLPAGSGSPKGAGAQMVFSAATAEAGTAIAWTDLDGRKLGSHAWGWDGAFALARDEGAHADKSIYAFALRFGILRAMKTDGSSADRQSKTPDEDGMFSRPCPGRRRRRREGNWDGR